MIVLATPSGRIFAQGDMTLFEKDNISLSWRNMFSFDGTNKNVEYSYQHDDFYDGSWFPSVYFKTGLAISFSR